MVLRGVKEGFSFRLGGGEGSRTGFPSYSVEHTFENVYS